MLYEDIAPPDMELTDGLSNIISSAKLKTGIFRGKDNKFHPVYFSEQNKFNSTNIEKTPITDNDKQENNNVKNTNKTGDPQLFYSGTLKLKHLSSDSINLQIFKDNTTGVIARDNAARTIVFEDKILNLKNHLTKIICGNVHFFSRRRW